MGGGFSERNSTEAGFNNEVAILSFLGEHVFTNEVAIYLEWEKIFAQRKQSLSQGQNKASVYRFRSVSNIPHYFSQLCLMLGDKKYNNRLNSNHLEPRIVFNIFDPSSNLF